MNHSLLLLFINEYEYSKLVVITVIHSSTTSTYEWILVVIDDTVIRLIRFISLIHHFPKAYAYTNMVRFTCAAKHLCIVPHAPVDKIHRCRQCKEYLHVFCSGKGSTPPDDDCQNGLEYDCLLCCKGVPLGRFNLLPPTQEGNPSSTQCSSTSKENNHPCAPESSRLGNGEEREVRVVQQESQTLVTKERDDVPQHVIDFQKSLSATCPRALTGTTPKVSPPPCTEHEWIRFLQEVYETSPTVSSKSTVARQYPLLWNIVSKLHKLWIKDFWVHPNKSSNGTVFKQKVVRAILRNRKYVATSEVPATYQGNYRHLMPRHKEVFYYPLHEFMEFAKDTWMIDKGLAERQLKATTNDIMRLFGIALLSTNRDDLNALNTSKIYLRKDADGPLSLQDTIFYRYKQQFNDTGTVVSNPNRVMYLLTYHDIQPNDPERIMIDRDHTWLRDLYFANLKDYRRAMHKWKAGTGGGSGAPENYMDWNSRDDWDFSKYGGHKGDMLAWIYMRDKDEGFPLLEIYDDTPSSIVVEDDNGNDLSIGTPKKKKRSAPQDTIKEIGSSLTTAMTEGFNHMSRAMEMIAKTAAPANNHANSYEQATSDMMHEINNGFSTITAIEEHIDKLRVRQMDSTALAHSRGQDKDMYERQIDILTGSLQAAYKNLEKVLKKSEQNDRNT